MKGHWATISYNEQEITGSRGEAIARSTSQNHRAVDGENNHLRIGFSPLKCRDDMRAPCDAYIIAATRSGIPETLPKIFPGCRGGRWQPVQKPLSEGQGGGGVCDRLVPEEPRSSRPEAASKSKY